MDFSRILDMAPGVTFKELLTILLRSFLRS